MEIFNWAYEDKDFYWDFLKRRTCLICEREIINKDMITEKGCIWCDAEYHQKKKKKKS